MTLQEYLVKLGFSVDEPSFKKFVSVVTHAGGVTAELGAAAIETVGAVEFMVSRVASHYESLYYMSARTNQSVRYLQTTQYGFEQIGLSADQASSAIESFGATMRTNPWLQNFFGNNIQQAVANLKARFGDTPMGYAAASRMAQMAGIPEDVLRHEWLFGKEEAAEEADYARRLVAAGLVTQQQVDALKQSGQLTKETLDQLASKGHEFGKSFRGVEAELGIIETQIYNKLVDPMTAATKVVDQFLQRVSAGNATTGDWAGAGLFLGGTALTGVAVTKLLGRFISSMFRKIIPGPQQIKAAVKEAMEEAEKLPEKILPEVEELLPEAAAKLGFTGLAAVSGPIGWVAWILSWLLNMINPAGETDAQEAARRAGLGNTIPGMPKSGALPHVSSETANRISEAETFFAAHGFSPDAARGITSALFFESGRTLSPSAFNPQGGGRGALGIGQWRGPRIDAFRNLFGHDLTQSKYIEQLEYVLWELTEGTDKGALYAGKLLHTPGIGAAAATDTFLRWDERPGVGAGQEFADAEDFADRLSRMAAQQQNGGGGDVNVNHTQNVDTKIYVGDKATANDVIAAQDKVNNNLSKNTQDWLAAFMRAGVNQPR